MKLNLDIKNAGIEEMGAALAMLKEAALWLEAKNISQWKQWLEPDDKILEWVRQGFSNNEFFFARLDNRLAGMFRLTWDNDRLWEDRKAAAGYLHAFTTDRKLKDNNVGTAMLEWMEGYCRENNRFLLRLDCHAWSKPLRAYYEKHGFKYVTEKQLPFGIVALYEKAL
jgi:GNAT superfamily N-acetyltransferase